MTREDAIEKVKALPGWATMPRDAAALHVESLIVLGLLKVEQLPDIEPWLRAGGVIPINSESVATLINEVRRLRSLLPSKGTER